MCNDKRLEGILNRFKAISNENKQQHEKELKLIEKQKNELEEKLDMGLVDDNYETNHRSEELLELIKKYDFIIHGYKLETDIDEDDYEALLETYFCEKNDWTFTISNYEDLDIDEGIFAIRQIKNIETGEEIDFYCDLGCRNTPKEQLDIFLNFLSYNSLEAYSKTVYPYIYSLPYLLESQGYKVELIDFSIGLENCYGFMLINNEISISFELKKDGLICSLGLMKNKTKYKKYAAYKLDYNNDLDFGKLCDMLDAFSKHIHGECGFLENGKYYTQNDFSDFLRSFKDKENPYKESWNHYHIKIDEEVYDNLISKYTGQEILTHATISFNDAAQWSIGKTACLCKLDLSYHSKKDPSNCYLYMFFYEKEDYNEVLLDTLSFKGSFSEMCEVVRSYVTKMADIFDLEL